MLVMVPLGSPIGFAILAVIAFAYAWHRRGLRGAIGLAFYCLGAVFLGGSWLLFVLPDMQPLLEVSLPLFALCMLAGYVISHGGRQPGARWSTSSYHRRGWCKAPH